jgi:hypothetical protein
MLKHKLALAVLALCTARAARCEESYGGQIAVIDAISLGVGVAGIAVRSTPLMVLGGTGYQFGGPMIHLGHGRGYRAMGSFGLRQLLPVGGFLLGAALAPPCGRGELCSVRNALVGGLIGMGGGAIGAVVLDALWLGHEEQAGMVVTGQGLALRARFP